MSISEGPFQAITLYTAGDDNGLSDDFYAEASRVFASTPDFITYVGLGELSKTWMYDYALSSYNVDEKLDRSGTVNLPIITAQELSVELALITQSNPGANAVELQFGLEAMFGVKPITIYGDCTLVINGVDCYIISVRTGAYDDVYVTIPIAKWEEVYSGGGYPTAQFNYAFYYRKANEFIYSLAPPYNGVYPYILPNYLLEVRADFSSMDTIDLVQRKISVVEGDTGGRSQTIKGLDVLMFPGHKSKGSVGQSPPIPQTPYAVGGGILPVGYAHLLDGSLPRFTPDTNLNSVMAICYNQFPDPTPLARNYDKYLGPYETNYYYILDIGGVRKLSVAAYVTADIMVYCDVVASNTVTITLKDIYPNAQIVGMKYDVTNEIETVTITIEFRDAFDQVTDTKYVPTTRIPLRAIMDSAGGMVSNEGGNVYRDLRYGWLRVLYPNIAQMDAYVIPSNDSAYGQGYGLIKHFSCEYVNHTW